jgi:hypothetical protein
MLKKTINISSKLNPSKAIACDLIKYEDAIAKQFPVTETRALLKLTEQLLPEDEITIAIPEGTQLAADGASACEAMQYTFKVRHCCLLPHHIV